MSTTYFARNMGEVAAHFAQRAREARETAQHYHTTRGPRSHATIEARTEAETLERVADQLSRTALTGQPPEEEIDRAKRIASVSPPETETD